MRPEIAKNVILYRGRYIRRWWSKPFGYQYIVMWAEESREKQFWNGSLIDLLDQIKTTDYFFGKWRFLF